jgi:hypothetical protein
MPMIDVYATAGTFAQRHDLAQDLARAVLTPVAEIAGLARAALAEKGR